MDGIALSRSTRDSQAIFPLKMKNKAKTEKALNRAREKLLEFQKSFGELNRKTDIVILGAGGGWVTATR